MAKDALVLRLEGLTCRYGKITAVRDLSLEVRQGELVTLIGANGAGKTTTLKAISGLLRPLRAGLSSRARILLAPPRAASYSSASLIAQKDGGFFRT